MRQVRTSDLIAAALRPYQIREALEAFSGLKVSRLNVTSIQLPPLLRWAKEAGLYVSVSEFGVEPVLPDEGKGQWFDLGEKNNEPGDLSIRYVYLARNSDDGSAAQHADETENHLALGQLLAIPECCTAFYISNRDVARELFFDDYANITTLHTGDSPPFPWLMNYLGEYFGYSLIHHFPCSWTCEESLSRAKTSFGLVKELSNDLAAQFRRHLRAIAVIEPGLAVHTIRGPETRTPGVYYYRRSDLITTRSTPLYRELFDRRTIDINEFNRTAENSNTRRRESAPTIVLPFTAV